MNIKDTLNHLPTTPGVYLFKNKEGVVIYVGKAAVLKARVSSYFNRPHDARIEELVKNIAAIETRPTPSVLEALVLESKLIKQYQPKYNVREKDDKSWLFICITTEDYPKPILVRQKDLGNKKKYKKIFGPYTSTKELRVALTLLRKMFGWSYCLPAGLKVPLNRSKEEAHSALPEAGQPPVADPVRDYTEKIHNKQTQFVHGKKVVSNGAGPKSCFDYKIGLCPGVCMGISKRDYAKHIRYVTLFLEGKKTEVIKMFGREMKIAAKEEDFEVAAKLRNRMSALEHIRDTALLLEPEEEEEEDLTSFKYSRIEGYDISNISGTSATGSMVVFQNNRRAPGFYRKFKIKTIETSNDVGMLKEVIRRRLRHSAGGEAMEYWPEPDLLLIDGGKGQVNAALEVLKEFNLSIPVVGIAKGAERKKNEFVFGQEDKEVKDWVSQNEKVLIAVRDEAHRYAVAFHRQLRGRRHF